MLEQCTHVLDADSRTCDTATTLTLTAGASPAAGGNATLRSGVMDDETTMDHQPTPVHVRLGTKLNLAKYPAYQVTNAIGVTAGLTVSEVRDVNIQERYRTLSRRQAGENRRRRNLVVCAGLRSLTLTGERHNVTAYVPAEAHHARFVVHGLPKDIPDDQLLSIISIADRLILAERRIGQSESIPLTVKGATIDKEVKLGLWLTKTQPFRPRAATTPMYAPRRMNLLFARHVVNSSLPANYPDVRLTNCPKKQQAEKLARIASEKRRLKSTPEDSPVPQKSQTSQSRTTKPTKKNDENFPSLPLQNRFSALQDTTPDPQPEPLPRSGSLPGYTTKQPAPPPPKPKTPSYIRALLSQKPPVSSEEPPHKQPRQCPLGKDVCTDYSTSQVRTIVGLDIKGAFDHVAHAAVLEGLRAIRPGQKFLKNFLIDHTVAVQVNEVQTRTRYLQRGVPQGSILSPTLFSLALNGLTHSRKSVPGIHFTIYADDISLWATEGSPSNIQYTLRSAIDTSARYLEERGLTLSGAKSEYIVVTNRKLPNSQEDRQLVTLSIKNEPIPRKPCIKYLGFWLQDDGKSKEWLRHTTKQLQQAHRLLKRTTHKLRGIKEDQLRRMTLALAIPRVMYEYPYIEITKTQKSKLETLLRQISRTLLGTP
ncbi:hypothetical protein HPB50_010573 [Hyalomma asiaticum]|uniref:Uncharacterized protein n=1 Tax=Hyalomma asiaticum TaxID=266040 RepID=A0ACB7SV65_HYAAI|nr:hypothetical protein HPB50_010573 [Hyalomma asiaticum]